MKTIKDFSGFHVKDIVTLCDLQTQTEFNKLSVDFIITEVRTYKEPNEYFKYTCYLATYRPPVGDEQEIMLMVRQIGDEFDLRVFYMDSSGPLDVGEDVFAGVLLLKDEELDRELLELLELLKLEPEDERELELELLDPRATMSETGTCIEQNENSFSCYPLSFNLN